MSRIATKAGTLARLGFGDSRSAAAVIEGWLALDGSTEDAVEVVVTAVLASADPDLALSGLNRLVTSTPGFLAELAADDVWRPRLVQVLGASVAFSQHLTVHSHDGNVLRGDIERRSAHDLRVELLTAVGADASAAMPVAQPKSADELRRAYRRALLRITARDVTAADPQAELPDIAGELADLADATVEAALALARAEVPGAGMCRLGIIALGKTGAQELNYVSDVDVLYVAEPARDADGNDLCRSEEAVAIGTKLAGALTRVCSDHTAAGTIWQIDAALRPEGKAGPLVRTLSSHRAYYEKWAKNWEFQAMLKARPMAGDVELAGDFVDMVWPLVWNVASKTTFVSDVQAMRKRVISLIPAREVGREIKLGSGGLRDVEFSVQLLQLVHGRADTRLRLRGTLAALEALIEFGYVGRSDGYDLGAAYRFQRLLEHRIQLFQLRRTHLLPTDDPSLRRLARSVGVDDAAELNKKWASSTRKVLRLHQRIFYSPILETVARIPSDEVHLTSEAAETRLLALGYGDPKAALRHIQALSQGMTRQSEIQRQLLPAMLGWFAAGPNPDHGLLAFRQVSEALGATHWYLRALRDEGAMAEHLARVLASSRFAVDLLMRAPQAVSILAETSELSPRSATDILSEMRKSAKRHASADEAIEVVRAVRRRELLRLAMGDILGQIALPALGVALSELMDATVEAALEIASRDVANLPPLAVIAMGRWGGRELSYGSDADAMVVIADTADPDATKAATAVITRVRALLAKPGPDPAAELDLDLRPEGKGGPMVRTLASYVAYYERWAATWEGHALLRASVAAGNRDLGETLLTAVTDVRFPPEGLTAAMTSEIRKLKARMEVERMPRGTDPSRNTKLGPGGLSDVEWVTQVMQLNFAATVPSLRTTRTLDALTAARRADLLSEADEEALREAWVLASRIRNAIMLLRGRPSDALPTDIRELSAIGQILGYGKGEASVLVEDYRHRTRHARQVMDRLFWGL